MGIALQVLGVIAEIREQEQRLPGPVAARQNQRNEGEGFGTCSAHAPFGQRPKIGAGRGVNQRPGGFCRIFVVKSHGSTL